MGAIQEIFRRHGAAYRERFTDTLPASRARVIDAISGCRSAASGSVLFQCEDCGEPHVVARCCVRWRSRRRSLSGAFCSTYCLPDS